MHTPFRQSVPPRGGFSAAYVAILIACLAMSLLAVRALVARRPATAAAHAATPLRSPYDPAATPRAIAAFSSRVRADNHDWLSLNLLAGYYLQRCRETGDIADAVRAERIARQSLATFSRGNDGARVQLASSLLTQHRFSEALAALPAGRSAPAAANSRGRGPIRSPRAATRRSASAESPQTLLLRAEITMEMGDYDAAAEEVEQARQQEVNPNTLALRARLLEINGHPADALAQMRQAQAAADANPDMPAPNAAWFHMRVGNILADMGRAAEADAAYREALAIFPNDYRTLAALAKLAAGRSDWPAALRWGRRAAAIVPTPEVVALLGDAHAAQGDRLAAAEQYRIVDTIARIARAQGAIYDRQRALFCADHDRSLDEALALARRELRVRHDVYAYDTLAWVCTRKGLVTEARAATERAMSRSTQDARLFYHAGRCALAAGDTAHARMYLTQALQIDPGFLPFAPAEARALLARMDRR
ncbi:MAG TPA: hypothetical protein VKT77_17925 [Chthonomonadaceae bacterium]|nr:hypothetical protein [Chthonomonadaceae bacterium]